MKVVEAAQVLPDMSVDEFEALCADIKKNGLLVPIELLGGKILDGRHREKACEVVGVTPEYVEVTLGDQTAGEYVWSMNGARRHLTASQRACVAVKLLPEFKAKAKERQRAAGKTHGRGQIASGHTSGTYSGEARDQAGKLVGVSGRHVQRAEEIAAESPKTFDRCHAGELTLTQAKRELRETRHKS